MERSGIKSDFALYKSLIIGCVKNNQMEMALKVYQNMRTLGIRSQNVYRLEKMGGSSTTVSSFCKRGRGGFSPESTYQFAEDQALDHDDPQDMREFNEIVRQASGRHTKWRKNNFLL